MYSISVLLNTWRQNIKDCQPIQKIDGGDNELNWTWWTQGVEYVVEPFTKRAT